MRDILLFIDNSVYVGEATKNPHVIMICSIRELRANGRLVFLKYTLSHLFLKYV